MASTVVRPHRTYETASVLFIDIVSYSIQTIDQQAQLLTMLQEVVRSANEYQRGRLGEELIVLPTGDGMALVFMRDPISSVRCAVEIAGLLLQTEVKIRMGVHIGPVCRHSDIKEEINVVGGGINLAQRVMDCGDAGHILLSRNAAEVLQQLDEWRDCLHDLGAHTVKHGVEIHLFNLCKDAIGNGQLPRKLAETRAAKEETTALQERALDVAIAKLVPILQPTELVALIRMLNSEGLRKVLAVDSDSDLMPEDVRSKPLTLDFSDDNGMIMAFRTITVRIDSPDFWPRTQSSSIRVPAVGDSPPITFLLTPVQLGDLLIKIELYLGESVVLSRVLRTSASNSDRIPAQVPQTVLTIPISVVLPKDIDLAATLSSDPQRVSRDARWSLLEQIVEQGQVGQGEVAAETWLKELMPRAVPNEPKLPIPVAGGVLPAKKSQKTETPLPMKAPNFATLDVKSYSSGLKLASMAAVFALLLLALWFLFH